MNDQTRELLMTVNRGQNGEPIFEAGKSYTIFRISGLAMTAKQIIKVVGFDADGHPIYKDPWGKKRYLLRLKDKAYASAPDKMFDGLVFEGEVPFSCDTDSKSPYYTGRMRGNALYNLVGEAEIIRKTIQEKQRNPWADIAAVVHQSKDEVETPLFPELYQGGHAVMDRILEKRRAVSQA